MIYLIICRSCNCQPMDYQVNVKVRCLIYLYSKFLNAQPEVQIFELAVGCRNVSFFPNWLCLILFFVHIQENGTLVPNPSANRGRSCLAEFEPSKSSYFFIIFLFHLRKKNNKRSYLGQYSNLGLVE